jgi:hypothetical protein
MSREGVPLLVIQRQHAHLGITSTHLRGIDNTEIIHTVHQRPAPMIPPRAASSPPPDRQKPCELALAARPRTAGVPPEQLVRAGRRPHLPPWRITRSPITRWRIFVPAIGIVCVDHPGRESDH